MNLTRRQTLFGFAAVSLGIGGSEEEGVGADPGPPASKHAYVLGKLSYFDGNYPFIDRVKSGAGFNAGSGTRVFNAKGWLASLGPGAHAQMLVVAGASWFPPGDYRLVSTSAATLSVSPSPGIAKIVNGVGLCTFTVSDLGDADSWQTFNLYLNCVNSTGSNIAVADLKCHLVSNQVLVDAGEIFEPDYLRGLQGAKALRFAEWLGQNFPGGNPVDGLWKFSDYGLQNEDKTSYLPIAGSGGPCISIFMKLCKKIGARPWVNIGNAGNVALCTYTASDNRLRPTAWLAGRNRFADGVGLRLATPSNPVAFTAPFNPQATTYHVVNRDSGSFQLSATIGGSPVTIAATDLDIAGMNFAEWAQVTDLDEHNDMFLPFARACFDADPEAHPLVEYSNEVWNSGYGIYPYNYYINSGVRLGSGHASTGYLWQALKCFKAFEQVYPPSQVGRVVAWFTGILQGYLAMTGAGQGLNFRDPGVFDNTKTFGQILLQAPERCYYAVAPYINLDDGAGHSGPGAYTAATAYAANGNSTSYSDAFWDSQFERSIAYNVDHKQAGMTAIRASLARYLPGVRLCFYEWGQQAFWGSLPADAKWKTTAESLSAYLESKAGRDMYERAWARNIAPYNLDFVNFYDSEGSRAHSATSFSHWGIRNQNTDNPASLWFRTK
jgi:hypothetical protein